MCTVFRQTRGSVGVHHSGDLCIFGNKILALSEICVSIFEIPVGGSLFCVPYIQLRRGDPSEGRGSLAIVASENIRGCENF